MPGVKSHDRAVKDYRISGADRSSEKDLCRGISCVVTLVSVYDR